MTLYHIGATTTDIAPCYDMAAWEALLAAMAAGDSEAIERITLGTKPTYVATAKLQEVEAPSMADAAAAYWQKRGKAPKALHAGPDGTPIVASVRT